MTTDDAAVPSTTTDTATEPALNATGPTPVMWNRITRGAVWFSVTLIAAVRSSVAGTVAVVPSGFSRISGHTVVSPAKSVRDTE